MVRMRISRRFGTWTRFFFTRMDRSGFSSPATRSPRCVLHQIAGGNHNRDIAERLFISEETVKVHIKHIMDKLGATDRTQAVAIALKRGIIQL